MIIKGNSDEYSINTFDGETIDSYMDKIVGALILEGFAVQTIYDGFMAKLEDFKDQYKCEIEEE